MYNGCRPCCVVDYLALFEGFLVRSAKEATVLEGVRVGWADPLPSRGAGSTCWKGLGCDWALSSEARLAVNLSARTKKHEATGQSKLAITTEEGWDRYCSGDTALA